MFGTLKYTPEEKEPRFIGLADSSEFAETGMPQHSACQVCRGRKVRCDGQKPSCQRCQSGKLTCKYTPARERRRRRESIVRRERKQINTESSFNEQPPPAFATALTPVAFDSLLANSGSDHSLIPRSDSITQLSLYDNNLMTASEDQFSLFMDESLAFDEPSNFDGGLVDQSSEAAALDENDSLFNPFETPMTDNCGRREPDLMSAAGRSKSISTYPSMAAGSRLNLSASNASCNCFERALELLDELELQSNNVSLSRIITALELQRRALKQCCGLLLCETCARKTARVTLLIMSIQRIAEFSDHIVTGYLEQNTHPEERQLSSVVLLGEYEMDSSKEMLAVLHTLILLRLKDMISTKQRVAALRWDAVKDSHIAKLNSAEQLVRRSALRLREYRGTGL